MRKHYLLIIFIGIVGFILWIYFNFCHKVKVWENLGDAITSFILFLAFLAAIFYGLETKWLREETARRPHPSLLYNKDDDSIELKNYGEGSASNIIVTHQHEKETIPFLNGFGARRGGVSGNLKNISYKNKDEYTIEYKDINEKKARKTYLIADYNAHDGFWPQN